MKHAKNNAFVGKIDEEILELQRRYEDFKNGEAQIQKFEDFPLTQKTLQGLTESSYVKPTKIQKESIVPALLRHDVVGAAITGSGKTLAFLIPVLEILYMKKWTRTDGLGAIIISPTRELAYQIFEVLRKIGKYHDFSAALIIGGKNLHFEKSRMDQCNILICTPGRLLQHMDENPLFDAFTMELLVLDEADRCLDMGFEECLNGILDNLPTSKQTMLFSATQNISAILSRIKLREPIFTGDCSTDVSKQTFKVPDSLQQLYVVINLEDKITMIWSFVKNHLKQKIIVFLSSCKQVKYTYELFSKLRPGIACLALYGTLSQDRRILVYNEFLRKKNVVLFATDIASRGLDFPSVNWVIQLDCPEDIAQYIHRAGRSARNETHGESLLVLLPSEEDVMVAALNSKNISLKKMNIDPKKLFSPRAKIESLCAKNVELKASAQRAFVSYFKSICLMKNKNLFQIQSLNLEAYAKSLGLEITPRLRFLERANKKKNQSDKIKVKDPLGQMIDENDESDDEFFKIKRVNYETVNDEDLPLLNSKSKVVTKAALAKKVIKKKIQINKKQKFDDDHLDHINDVSEKDDEIEHNGIDFNVCKKILSEEDKSDKKRFKELVKSRHRKEKLKKKILNDDFDEMNQSDEIDSKSLSSETDTFNKKAVKRKSDSDVKKPKIKATRASANIPLLNIPDVENLAAELLALS